MDRLVAYPTVHGSSFSVASLADGSEPISEAEEINEVLFLQEKGDKALKVSQYSDALRFYSEALEIDDRNTDVLLARATTYIKMKNYTLAHKDTLVLTALCPDHSQAHFLHGVALKYLKKCKEALTEFLIALNLDRDSADLLTNHIAATAASFCKITPEIMDSLKEMDAYKKMSEVGVCLFAAKKYSLCIKVLDAAQKFRTNQKGITMRVLLTLANAHSALKHEDQAIGLYQECLAIASSIHDHLYQTKALVNIATLNLIVGDYHQAIVHYEKMLDLEAELQEEAGEGRGLPEFWTIELQSGLHLNLSVAFKTIGNMTEAMRHALKYMRLLEHLGASGKQRAESYYNVGMLNVILQNFKEAAENYHKFLEVSENNGDQKGIAQAYGCLGTVHASLGNWKRALRYHDRDIILATKMGDTRMQTMAHEMKGDTLMTKKEYEEAVDAYDAMLACCRGADKWLEAMGYCKTANAYKGLKKYQYSLYFYEKALLHFSDPKFKLIQTTCMFNMALILADSKQLADMEQARGYLGKLIPHFEAKIQQHREEDSHCEASYHTQLRQCYDAMQTVLVKQGRKDAALQYAEAFRRRTIIDMPNFQATPVTKLTHGLRTLELTTMDKLLTSVSQQNALVLYYSLLPKQLLLWVLTPPGELVRFYCSKSLVEGDMVEEIHGLVSEFMKGRDHRQMITGCENRALPQRKGIAENLSSSNGKKSVSVIKEQNQGDSGIIGSCESQDLKKKPSAQRRLYNRLLGPIEDILAKLPTGSPLAIIPDRSLSSCPFGCLEDWTGKALGETFSITSLPSMLSLDVVVRNEQEWLKAQDELNFERVQSRCGSMNKYLTQYVLDNCVSSDSSPDDEPAPPINPKQISNPNLLRESMSHLKQAPDSGRATPTTSQFRGDPGGRATGLGQTCPVTGRKSTSPLNPLPELVQSVSLKSLKPLGSPPCLTKLLHHDTLSTLTPWTSTGTDITRSHRMITEYCQISDKDRCVVIGNPKLPQSLMLNGKQWLPGEDLSFASQEVKFVSSYLDVDPISGPEATKERFLEEITTATVIHIASYGCWENGTLAMTPNDLHKVDDGCPQEAMYLVTPGDLLNVRMKCQLVVLSCGWSPYRTDAPQTDFLLASAFLTAGTQCVLQSLWAVPNDAVEKFYYHFYEALQTGSLLSTALATAVRALQEDSRFSDPFFWAGFVLIGKDVRVDVGKIRHAMLDQKLDEMEETTQDLNDKEWLNPKTKPLQDPSKEELLTRLQLYLCKLLRDNHRQPETVSCLIDLLDEALKRLHTSDNNNKTTRLHSSLTNSHGAMDVLHFLGFHFQARGPFVENPYVVYPHWNLKDLLVPTYDALKSLTEIAKKPVCVQALCDLLPLTQEVISHLIDLLSITKHAVEIQLKVSDLSVRPLWRKAKVKALLLAMGFHQIGMLLAFSNVPVNRRVLTAVLQLLLTVSCHKSQVLLYRLDVSLLGKPPTQKTSVGINSGKLPSLNPVIVHKSQVKLSTPWMSVVEKPEEMTEKMRLAKSKRNTDRSFGHQLEKARSWHQITVAAQGEVALDVVGRPKTSPSKVKVKPVSTMSHTRIPVSESPKLGIPETAQRREYAHFILDRRLQEVTGQNQTEVRNLYLPYVQAM